MRIKTEIDGEGLDKQWQSRSGRPEVARDSRDREAHPPRPPLRSKTRPNHAVRPDAGSRASASASAAARGTAGGTLVSGRRGIGCVTPPPRCPAATDGPSDKSLSHESSQVESTWARAVAEAAAKPRLPLVLVVVVARSPDALAAAGAVPR
ncbi:hypothetical protein ACCO45_006498 [Purpureocillium lilacinum]|uniref:Uncharacterized protein n=1 Tax=Purpureocillium lilacinum TaxID=33203 RepID=A0ACC4DPM7_PURLI